MVTEVHLSNQEKEIVNIFKTIINENGYDVTLMLLVIANEEMHNENY